jgi:hypothetical protein
MEKYFNIKSKIFIFILLCFISHKINQFFVKNYKNIIFLTSIIITTSIATEIHHTKANSYNFLYTVIIM